MLGREGCWGSGTSRLLCTCTWGCGASGVEKWFRTLGRHFHPALPRDCEVGGSAGGTAGRERFRVERLDDLLCLWPMPFVLARCEARKKDSREESGDMEESGVIDMAGARWE